jgi:hypothetical protein
MSLVDMYKQLYEDMAEREVVHGGTFAVIKAIVADVQAGQRPAGKAIEHIAEFLAQDDRDIAELATVVQRRERDNGSFPLTGTSRPCENETEPDGDRCTGTLTFADGDAQARCPVCHAWTGRLAPRRVIADDRDH